MSGGFEHGIHKAAGIVIATNFDGVEVQRDTGQCVHCGGHWIVQKGSGKPHVFCSRCNGNTCSQPKCLKECYPIQKRFDDTEKYGHERWLI